MRLRRPALPVVLLWRTCKLVKGLAAVLMKLGGGAGHNVSPILCGLLVKNDKNRVPFTVLLLIAKGRLDCKIKKKIYNSLLV